MAANSTQFEVQVQNPGISLPNMSVPPPAAPNLSAPPPMITTINPTANYQPRYKDNRPGFFKTFKPYHAPKLITSGQDLMQDEFDGKRLRKSVMRKTVDYNSSIIKALENRIWQRDYRDRKALQPDVIYYPELLPPPSYLDNPINAVTTRFVKTATNKMRCPIFCMAWTPEGRRLVTGASSGEFTLWNGLTFNFETILQAHDSPVRTMVWSHNESWMVTGDHAGYVKYWQSNMNNVKMFQAHKEAIRGLSFSPTDHKLATCSDDGTVRIWDFFRCYEEKILRGHGADVKCVHWHPQKSLVISGSKDNQQPVKLWDPKSGQSLATLHAHKSTVMDVKWNENGNWLVTASRDHLLKLFDLRNLSQEVQTFRGHKKEASSVAWHPSHEGLFCSGGSDGAILFWHVGADKEVGGIEQAHDSIVWTLAWHPLGHILCSGSNDHTSKFWTRNRPGDQMRDKYNLNTLPAGAGGIDDHEIADEAAIIPGMGPEDRINNIPEPEEQNGEIPGLDIDASVEDNKKATSKKVPYSKPIPRNFQAQWNEMESEENEQADAVKAIVDQIIETTPGAVPLSEVTPNAIILYGKIISVEPGSELAKAIAKGTDAINKLVLSGGVEELRDVIGLTDDNEDSNDYLQDSSEFNYKMVPKVALPTPLPSSKFAQNPDLLQSLNFGGKRKFDQLIGWSDANINNAGNSMQEPVALFNESQTDNTQVNSSKMLGANVSEKLNSSYNSFGYISDDNYTRNTSVLGNNSVNDNKLYLDEKFKSSITATSTSSGLGGFDLKRNSLYFNKEIGQLKYSFLNKDKIQDHKQNWNSEDNKTDITYSENQSEDEDEEMVDRYNSNQQNMPNINTELPPPNILGLQNKLGTSRNSPVDHLMNPSVPPPFRPSIPPPPLSNSFNPLIRPPALGDNSFNNDFKSPGPFPSQNPPNLFACKNFSSPHSNFRGPNPSFDRSNFQSNFNRSGGNQQHNFKSNFSNFGRGRGGGGGNNDNRINFHNNRGRGRDDDQSNRGRRGRDY